MHEITNFRGGVVTNLAYHPGGRNQSAQESLNNRVNDLGWLIPRKGRVRISDIGDIDSVFSHRNLIFIIRDNSLYWAFAPTDTLSDVEFRRIENINLPEPEERRRVTWSVYGDTIFVRGGSEAVTLKIPEYALDAPTAPEATPFYLDQVDVDAVEISYDNSGTDVLHDPRSPVNFVFQAVYVDETENPQEMPPVFQGNTDGEYIAYAPARAVGERSDPVEVYTQDQHGNDANPDIRDLTANINFSSVPENANYIDVFSTTGGRDGGYYRIARMPAWTEYTTRYVFPFEGDIDVGGDTVLTFEQPDWDYIAINEFRSYIASAQSNRIYLSYYDPATNEKLYQNYTDFIDLELGEGYITGLHFLRNNRLIVFCTNQIQVIATDPLLSLHSVIDFIKPRDDNGLQVGCAAPNSIVDMGGEVYFLATNNYVYRFNGQQIQQVSDPVQSIFSKVLQPRNAENNLDLQSAVGFAHGQDYVLSISIPAMATMADLNFPNLSLYANRTYRYDLKDYISGFGSTYTDFLLGTSPEWITLEGDILTISAPASAVDSTFEFLLVAEGFFPNTTMVLDRVHNVWWQDDFGVAAATKGTYGRIYGIIDGLLYVLYEGDDDDGEAILRTYKANPYYTRAQDRWESLHVYTQDEAIIDVFLSTEQAQDEGQLVITELSDWFSNRFGCNLRGRVHTIEIETESVAAIDRITTNERLRNR